jgi:hypothetical protein
MNASVWRNPEMQSKRMFLQLPIQPTVADRLGNMLGFDAF